MFVCAHIKIPTRVKRPTRVIYINLKVQKIKKWKTYQKRCNYAMYKKNKKHFHFIFRFLEFLKQTIPKNENIFENKNTKKSKKHQIYTKNNQLCNVYI